MNHFDSIAHDCSNSIPNALELLQSCTRPSTYNHIALPWCLTRVGNWLCNNGTTFPRTIAIIVLLHAWRRHKMEIMFVLLTLCERNPPVISGFPSQRPVTRRFDGVFFMCAWTNGSIEMPVIWNVMALIVTMTGMRSSRHGMTAAAHACHWFFHICQCFSLCW